MKNNRTVYLSFALLSALASFLWAASAQKKPASNPSIIGKWRVVSEYPNITVPVKNHTYEFLTNNTCIEKYRSEQLGGSPEEPLGPIEQNVVITYRYKALGGKRFRLYETNSLVEGKPTHWGKTWHILDVNITDKRAAVYIADKQVTETEKMMEDLAAQTLNAAEKNGKQQKKVKAKPLKRLEAVWMRIP